MIDEPQGTVPTPEEVAHALSHLAPERALEYIRNAAGYSGQWTPQLRKLERLVLARQGDRGWASVGEVLADLEWEELGRR
jgi:hypothetical protein